MQPRIYIVLPLVSFLCKTRLLDVKLFGPGGLTVVPKVVAFQDSMFKRSIRRTVEKDELFLSLCEKEE